MRVAWIAVAPAALARARARKLAETIQATAADASPPGMRTPRLHQLMTI
jgi:hypothetical protein